MQTYQKARLARDIRYDGKFFVAVKTTKIYCRPICPAPSPKEKNVLYFDKAIQAQDAGFRPCRRCRPESAPQSAAWLGTQAVFNRAMNKIHAGELNHQAMADFCEPLGISERYLRKLFQQHIGTSPRQYANHIRLMFAKQLLHQTRLNITDIAFSAGFNSIRRFNDAFKKTIRLTPSDIRNYQPCEHSAIQLRVHYQGDYNWKLMQQFLKQREISSFESVKENSYERTFLYQSPDDLAENISGIFKASHKPIAKAFDIQIEISNIRYLMPVLNNIKRILDINTNTQVVENHLKSDPKLSPLLQKGLRLPATWDTYEAGIKAILGQQVSVKAAYTHTAHLIEHLGAEYNKQYKTFPTPEVVVNADVSFLKMPNARKETLKYFSQWYIQNNGQNLETILDIKGIGPWTLEYIKLRSGIDTDAFPEKDLGIIKAMKTHQITDTQQWKPWRSYATLQLWNSL